MYILYISAYNISFLQLYWIFISISTDEKKNPRPKKKRLPISKVVPLGCVSQLVWSGLVCGMWCERVGAGAQTTEMKTFIWHGGFPQNGGENPNKPMGFFLLKMDHFGAGDWYHDFRKHPYTPPPRKYLTANAPLKKWWLEDGSFPIGWNGNFSGASC